MNSVPAPASNLMHGRQANIYSRPVPKARNSQARDGGGALKGRRRQQAMEPWAQNGIRQALQGPNSQTIPPLQGLILIVPTQGFDHFATFALGFATSRFQRSAHAP